MELIFPCIAVLSLIGIACLLHKGTKDAKEMPENFTREDERLMSSEAKRLKSKDKHPLTF